MDTKDRKLEVRNILVNNDKTIKWLQDKLPGVDVYYLLSENSQNFDVGIYDKIMSIFKKEGFIVTESEKCNKLLSHALHINAVINHSLEVFNISVKDTTEDEILEFNEIKRLDNSLDKMEAEFSVAIDKARKILRGKLNG